MSGVKDGRLPALGVGIAAFDRFGGWSRVSMAPFQAVRDLSAWSGQRGSRCEPSRS